MRVEYLLLADKAEAIAGKVYMLGGGWDTLNLAGIPALAAYDLVASVVFSANEAGTHEITFELIDPDGQIALGPFGGPMEAPPPEHGEITRLLMAVGGPFPHLRFGTHRWRMSVDGKVAGEVVLSVADSGQATASVSAPSSEPRPDSS